MKIDDTLYFAPGVPFSGVDLENTEQVINQYRKRIQRYYLDPAQHLINQDYDFAFSAGVILVTCIDAISTTNNRTQETFKNYIQEKLLSFGDEKVAIYFLDHFRNGLVHEGLIKNGSMFWYEHEETVFIFDDDYLAVNPRCLFDELTYAFEAHIAELLKSETARNAFIEHLKVKFKRELAII